MKKSILLSIIMFVSAFIINAQNDTMFVMKRGNVWGYFKVSDVDSVIFYDPGHYFTDTRDGTLYNTVQIGNQVWMKENLKYLPSVAGSETGSSTTPYYYVYDYSGTNVTDAKATENYKTYGVLYNWPAAMNGAASSTANPSGVQGVCPTGWHLPSDAEWTELTDYLGGTSVAGGELKEKGTIHWVSPNDGATNESGFTALGGGYREFSVFGYLTGYGYWWTSTEKYTSSAWNRVLHWAGPYVLIQEASMSKGFSVRCVKD